MENSDILINYVKDKFDLHQTKLILKEKYLSKLTVIHNGGSWYVTPEFISMLHNYPKDTLILKDNYDNPIKVNTKELLSKSIELYESAMLSWFTEYSELRKIR